MSWEPILFIVFSTIETFAVYYVMMSIYRLKPMEFIWEALFTILLMDLQSFVLREELSLSPLVPLINIFLFTLLLKTVVRVPIIWSIIISITGYFLMVLIQVGIVNLSFGLLTVDEIHASPVRGYLLQVLSGVIGIAILKIYNFFGGGFDFEFEKLKFKSETVIVYLMIIGTLLSSAILLSRNNSFLDVIFISIAVLFFLFYATRKEKESD
ncbi:hypothetical protein P40081_15540 [Paenibacillus sp. FSL P4-0081]|nr:hypothetical protein P40081_15540 [Paenibacillus sp. FSL P4-0081]